MRGILHKKLAYEALFIVDMQNILKKCFECSLFSNLISFFSGFLKSFFFHQKVRKHRKTSRKQ